MSVILAYLVRYSGMTLRQAYTHLKVRRPIIGPHFPLRPALVKWELSIASLHPTNAADLTEEKKLLQQSQPHAERQNLEKGFCRRVQHQLDHGGEQSHPVLLGAKPVDSELGDHPGTAIKAGDYSLASPSLTLVSWKSLETRLERLLQDGGEYGRRIASDIALLVGRNDIMAWSIAYDDCPQTKPMASIQSLSHQNLAIQRENEAAEAASGL